VGYDDGTFRPGNNATRGQITKILVLAEGWTQVCSTQDFSDVPPGSTFYCFIETALAHGIISGYPDGKFRPGNNVTRGQLSKMVVLAEGWPMNTPSTPTFRDVPAGSTFYQYIETAFQHGIINGYSCGTDCLEFRPGNDSTRGQIAKIVYLVITNP
jgi:ribosomal protein L30/L7E